MKDKKLAYLVGLVAAVAAGSLIVLAVDSPLSAHDDTEEKIYVVEGDVVAPVRLTMVEPEYPSDARKAKAEGVVVVRTVIDRKGKVASTEVVEAGRDDFGVAAIAAISEWTFEPATLEGEPVPVYYHLTVRFRMDREGGDKAGPDQSPSLK